MFTFGENIWEEEKNSDDRSRNTYDLASYTDFLLLVG